MNGVIFRQADLVPLEDKRMIEEKGYVYRTTEAV